MLGGSGGGTKTRRKDERKEGRKEVIETKEKKNLL